MSREPIDTSKLSTADKVAVVHNYLDFIQSSGHRDIKFLDLLLKVRELHNHICEAYEASEVMKSASSLSSDVYAALTEELQAFTSSCESEHPDDNRATPEYYLDNQSMPIIEVDVILSVIHADNHKLRDMNLRNFSHASYHGVKEMKFLRVARVSNWGDNTNLISVSLRAEHKWVYIGLALSPEAVSQIPQLLMCPNT